MQNGAAADTARCPLDKTTFVSADDFERAFGDRDIQARPKVDNNQKGRPRKFESKSIADGNLVLVSPDTDALDQLKLDVTGRSAQTPLPCLSHRTCHRILDAVEFGGLLQGSGSRRNPTLIRSIDGGMATKRKRKRVQRDSGKGSNFAS